MKILKYALLALLLSPFFVYSKGSYIGYYDMKDFMQASPGAFKYGLYGFVNPAASSYLNEPDILFAMSDRNDKFDFPKRWGLFTGTPKTKFFSLEMPSSGWGLFHEADSAHSVYDLRYSWAFGTRKFNFGVGFGYPFGDIAHFDRSGIYTLGALFRPMRYLSVGLQKTFAFESNEGETVGEIAVRPFGDYPLTFYGDAAFYDGENYETANWSAGVSWEVADGARINFRYFDDQTFALGFNLSFGNLGFSSLSQFDKNQNYGYHSYAVRVGAYDRTIVEDFFEEDSYVKMDLEGPLNYKGFLWFDETNKLLDILDKIDEAKKSSRVKGLAISLSGMSANMELMWELREKLKDFKSAGKKVVMFIDRVSLPKYHFASVADIIIMDPQGSISLTGYATGRSYYKKLLADVGIGFEELRYFKYKSAYENFSRQEMSEADREQRQAMIDDWHEISKKEICEGRGFNVEKFDSLVNGAILYGKKEALAENLVDTIGRWTDAKDIIKEIDEKASVWKSSRLWKQYPPTDDKWGEPLQTLALIYALGVCDMDSGIKARELSKHLKKAAKDRGVSAIIIRVDSPGGDAMASDYIADLIRQYKDKKPIIVSQGAVAASGGYWISMDADTIVASPMTITGSIGVIGGWFYNKGIADSMGINTEIVKTGKYADLGYPFRLPIIPLGLPDRNLTEDEKAQMADYIKTHYKEFVQYVADGRDKSYEEIDSVAQGRVWTGKRAKDIGLIDEYGGLQKAIDIAKEAAGIDPDDEIMIKEYPKQELFDINALFGSVFGFEVKKDEETLEELKFLLENNGIPLPIMSLDYLKYVQDE